jgi:hypothetical protein
MAGKPITRGSGRLAYAVDALSKNMLADIILDRVQAEIGEDASDEAIAAHLQPWVDTVARLRGDKTVNLQGMLARLDRNNARYLEDIRRHESQQRNASS